MTIDIPISKIILGFDRDKLNQTILTDITKSVAFVGLQQPILVVAEEDKYRLISGRYRIASAIALGHEEISASIVEGDLEFQEMIQIAVDLHRRECTYLEKSQMFRRWLELEKLRTPRAVSEQGGRGHMGGTRAAARAIGIPESSARDMQSVALLTAEAKETAVETGLDDHASALKAAAKEEASNQAKFIHAFAAKREKPIDKSALAASAFARLIYDHVPNADWPSVLAHIRATNIQALIKTLEKVLGTQDAA